MSARIFYALEEKRTVSVRRLGKTRTVEIGSCGFLNKENITHQEMLAMGGARVGACAQGHDVLVITQLRDQLIMQEANEALVRMVTVKILRQDRSAEPRLQMVVLERITAA